MKSIFQNDDTNQRENSIEVTDLTENAGREMVRWSYTNKVENLERVAGKLLPGEMKYYLEGLLEANRQKTTDK